MELLKHLNTFRTVAEQGSFSKAASVLHTSQPAITHRIRQLENHVGAKLIDRDSHHFALTAAGIIAITHARTIEAELTALKASIRNLKVCE